MDREKARPQDRKSEPLLLRLTCPLPLAASINGVRGEGAEGGRERGLAKILSVVWRPRTGLLPPSPANTAPQGLQW